MHASLASITTEIDVDPTLVMLGVAFEDEADEDDAPTQQVAPPSELLEVAPAPVAQKVFALELLPLQPTLLRRVARGILRWAPFAALGASGGLLLCIGASALASSGPEASSGSAHVTSHFVMPAAPVAIAPAAMGSQTDVIELDEARAPDTIARRTRSSTVRTLPHAVTTAATVARPPPLAAMPVEYHKGR